MCHLHDLVNTIKSMVVVVLEASTVKVTISVTTTTIKTTAKKTATTATVTTTVVDEEVSQFGGYHFKQKIVEIKIQN